MAGEQKLIVAVIGDDSSFQKALARSTAAAKAFGSNVSRALTPRGDLFKRFGMQEQVNELRGLAKEVDKTNEALDRSASRGGESLGAFAAKAGLVSAGVTAAYQGSRQLSEGLETTGEEAFKSTGRLKNVGAALLSLDFVGAAKAASQTADSVEDLGLSSLDAQQKLRQLEAVARDNGLTLAELADKIDETGIASRELVEGIQDIVGDLRAAENAAASLADSTARLGTVFETTTGQAVAFKGAVDDLAGLRGPGAVAQINANLEQASEGLFRQAAQPRNRVNDNKQALARANGDLDELLALQVKERDRLRAAVRSKIGNEEERENLEDAYTQAQANVISTGKAIQANAKAQADADKDAAESARRAAEAAEREAEANRKAAAARRRALAEARRAAEQARQFRALGLDASGNRPPPTISNLLKQITQVSMRDELTGTQKGVLARIRKVIVDPLRKATPETRAAAKDLIDSIRNTFNKELGSSGPLTKTTSLRANKILAGLGLTPDLERELRARLSSFNSAGIALAGGRRPNGNFVGGVPVVQSNITLEMDGDVVARKVTKSQQKRKRRNPVQKRGPSGGV